MQEQGYASPRSAPPAFDPAGYPADRLRRAGEAWRNLRASEHDSVIAASLVLTDLARLGAPAALLGAAAQVLEDEVRHVEICQHVTEALGVAPQAIAPDAMRASLGDEAVGVRCGRTLVAGFVVGESMSAAAFAEALRRAEAPLARWALEEILRDETRHGGFGVEAGRWVLEHHGDPASTEALWPLCVREMEHMEAIVGGPYDDDDLTAEAARRDSAGLEALGVLRGSVSCAAFHRSVERWVVPRLRTLGVLPAAN